MELLLIIVVAILVAIAVYKGFMALLYRYFYDPIGKAERILKSRIEETD